MTGLSYKEVEERKIKGWYNGNCSIKTKSIKQIFYTNIFTLFNAVNVFFAVLLCMVGSYKNVMFMGVVLWNLVIGIVQEIRAKRVLDKLNLLQEPIARVIREGREQDILVEDIVLGDVVLLKNGNQISVDSVVLSGKCYVNESLLTGESEPVFKSEGDELLSGSFVISGSVVSRAVKVGKDSYANKIVQNAKYLKKVKSEVMNSIKGIIKLVTIILIPVGVLLFLNQRRILNGNIKESIESMVSAVIGMIPSGLVLLTTIVLAVSVIKLARKNALVKELYSIEGLARVNVLCIDKTGTLTEGKMEVEDIISVCDRDADSIEEILRKYVSVFGDENATGAALVEYFGAKGCEMDNIKEVFPFSSEKKYSAITISTGETFILGAYECIAVQKDDDMSKRVAECAKKGLRVIAFAWSVRPIVEERLPEDVQVLALVLLTDKIREDAEQTLGFFKEQGVLVKVISGDNPLAVSYISQKVGIESADKYIDAAKLDTEEKLREAAFKYNVFGRVTPEQKLNLIKFLKEQNTVAMIGDGVNDVMALKEADCSIAMEGGADAARNVSQLVLMNSSFESLPAVVAEGRQTVNNICRSAALYLNKTIFSTVFAVMFIFLPWQYPIKPIQLTLIGSLTVGIPSFILAMETNHNRIKGRFLKKVFSKALPSALCIVIGVIMMLILGKSQLCGYVLAVGSFANLINVSRPLNKFRSIVVILLLSIFILSVLVTGGFFEFVI